MRHVSLVALMYAIACSGPPPAGATQPATPAAVPPLPTELSSSAPAPPPASTPPSIAPAPSRLPERLSHIDARAQPGLAELARQLPRDARLWIGPLQGNGGRDVLVFVPPGARDDAEFELVYHFHGTHSERIAAKQPGMAKKEWVGANRLQQTLDAATDLQRTTGLNVVLVYPISAGKRREPGKTGWNNKEYDRIWMGVAEPGLAPEHAAAYTDSFAVLHEEVLQILRDEFGAHPSKLQRPVVVEGHSAGGIALYHIARSRPAAVREYLFLDASFQGWADGCWAAVREAKSGALVSMVVTIGGIADPFGKHDPWCTELEPDQDGFAQYQAWCDAMQQDMRGVPGVFLHRTRVSHGEQPRHFVGGLELPADRGKGAGAAP